MKTLIILVCLVTVIVWSLRVWRKREIKAFMASDARMLEGWQSKTELAEQQIDPILISARAYAERTGDQSIQLPLPTAAKKPEYLLKQQAFSTGERKLLEKLTSTLGRKYLVYTNVPLKDFIANPPAIELSLKFLICASKDLSIVAAACFEEDPNILKLREILTTVERPLWEFKRTESVSVARIKLLVDLLENKQSRRHG